MRQHGCSTQSEIGKPPTYYDWLTVWLVCTARHPFLVGAASPGSGPALGDAPGRGGLLHPLLAAALCDVQVDGGLATDPRFARAGKGRHEDAAEWGQQPVGPGHADAPLQHTVHALHLLSYRRASHPGMGRSPALFHLPSC